MLEKPHRTHKSSARFVRRILRTHDLLAVVEPARKVDWILHTTFLFAITKNFDIQNACRKKKHEQTRKQVLESLKKPKENNVFRQTQQQSQKTELNYGKMR